LGGAPEDLDLLKPNRDLGVGHMTARLLAAKKEEEILRLQLKLVIANPLAVTFSGNSFGAVKVLVQL